MEAKLNWIAVASTIPATVFAASTVASDSSNFIPETSSMFITETIAHNEETNKKQFENRDGYFVYTMSPEKSINQIKDKINAIFSRELQINLRFDSELDIYYLVVYTSEKTFEVDYEHLLTVDERMNDITFKGKKVIVTLEEA
ncbi:hypothetical protein [Enterococcus faecalis]|uniref:hypothetical protein n=2 Tax=Enterococcus faecalis TaxID=1351 RepID=UPI001D09F724|nr:hypothetical protein [Enterococcus faecalis]MCB8514029.1 hypothetical protein [Enterococcus faecalis]